MPFGTKQINSHLNVKIAFLIVIQNHFKILTMRIFPQKKFLSH